jgi:hypothetical protein
VQNERASGAALEHEAPGLAVEEIRGLDERGKIGAAKIATRRTAKPRPWR